MGVDAFGGVGVPRRCQPLAENGGHVFWFEVAEIEGVSATYFGKRGSVRAEYWFSPLHCLDYRETETFGDGGEEEGGAMRVEPSAFTVVNNTDNRNVGMMCKLGPQHPCIRSVVVSCDYEVIVGKAVHQWQQRVQVLFFLNFSKR